MFGLYLLTTPVEVDNSTTMESIECETIFYDTAYLHILSSEAYTNSYRYSFISMHRIVLILNNESFYKKGKQ